MKKKYFFVTITFMIFMHFICDNNISSKAEECNVKNSYVSLENDQCLMFFPTYAKREGRILNVKVHAWVFEPERNSIKRNILINLIKRDFNISETEQSGKNFKTMAHYLLVDQERHKDIFVTIGEKSYSIGATDNNGHAEAIITIKEEELQPFIKHDRSGRSIYAYTQTKSKPIRIFTGHIQLIEEKGVFVISDIDDTIKITNVNNTTEMIKNTFIKSFMPVPGMAKVYRALAKKNVQFFYLTASPWQLYEPLFHFLQNENFPTGIFIMKYFGFSKNLSNLFAPAETVKIPSIKQLMKDFPNHRFILIGDSGERDPEIYGEFARDFPVQIAGIFIRNVSNETRNSARFKNAFNAIPPEKWELFENPNVIDQRISEILNRSKY